MKGWKKTSTIDGGKDKEDITEEEKREAMRPAISTSVSRCCTSLGRSTCPGFPLPRLCVPSLDRRKSIPFWPDPCSSVATASRLLRQIKRCLVSALQWTPEDLWAEKTE